MQLGYGDLDPNIPDYYGYREDQGAMLNYQDYGNYGAGNYGLGRYGYYSDTGFSYMYAYDKWWMSGLDPDDSPWGFTYSELDQNILKPDMTDETVTGAVIVLQLDWLIHV